LDEIKWYYGRRHIHLLWEVEESIALESTICAWNFGEGWEWSDNYDFACFPPSFTS